MNSQAIVSPVIEDIKKKMKRGKIVSLAEAMQVVRSGDTLAFDGFVGGWIPEELIIGLEKRFLETGGPVS